MILELKYLPDFKNQLSSLCIYSVINCLAWEEIWGNSGLYFLHKFGYYRWWPYHCETPLKIEKNVVNTLITTGHWWPKELRIVLWHDYCLFRAQIFSITLMQHWSFDICTNCFTILHHHCVTWPTINIIFNKWNWVYDIIAHFQYKCRGLVVGVPGARWEGLVGCKNFAKAYDLGSLWITCVWLFFHWVRVYDYSCWYSVCYQQTVFIVSLF